VPEPEGETEVDTAAEADCDAESDGEPLAEGVASVLNDADGDVL